MKKLYVEEMYHKFAGVQLIDYLFRSAISLINSGSQSVKSDYSTQSFR